MLSEYLLIGQVLRPQGIKGLVKVRPDTDDPERFKNLTCAYIKAGEQYTAMDVEDVQVRGEEIYLRLDHAPDRNAAEKQRNWMLYIDREHARMLAENETFICDLVGCQVRDRQGRELGRVVDVMQPGGNDVYVIKTPQGEMLLPALQFVIPEVRPAEGYILVNEEKLPEVAVCDWIPDQQ